MKTNDQRDMIEQLLGITEISQKADVLKELLKNTRDSIKEEEIRIKAVKNANDRVEKNIAEIELRGKAWGKNKKDKVNISEVEIQNKIELRNKARKNKDYKEADRIRDELLDKGVLIEDKDGTTLWKFK